MTFLSLERLENVHSLQKRSCESNYLEVLLKKIYCIFMEAPSFSKKVKETPK